MAMVSVRSFWVSYRWAVRLRDQMWIQSKCGIRKDGFTMDFYDHIWALSTVSFERRRSSAWIVSSFSPTDAPHGTWRGGGSHRFWSKRGKARHLGWFNQNPMMMELLKTVVKQPLKVNQLQSWVPPLHRLEAGFHVNMEASKAAVRDGSVFEYCRLTDTVIQAWSVLQHGYFKGNFCR